MKSFLKAAGIAGAAMSLGACATVARGTNTAWEVNTTPPGAAVKTSNGFYCDSTPCALKMPRKSEFNADITKAGYKSVHVVVTHKVKNGGAAGMAGNVVFGGIIGAGVDATTGAMLDLTPNPVNLTLEKDEAPAASPKPAAVATPASLTR